MKYSSMVAYLRSGAHLVEKVRLYTDQRKYFLMVPTCHQWRLVDFVSSRDFIRVHSLPEFTLISYSYSDDGQYLVNRYALR